MRILMIEDDREIAEIVRNGLELESHAVDVTSTGEEGEEMATASPYDLIILDLVLPGKDGLEVCRSLRQKGVKTPLMMLTCRNSIEDRVRGLDCGADDYMCKPFSLIELSARVRALLRRERDITSSRVQVGELIVDTANRLVWRGEQRIDLTAKELAMLEYLVYNLNVIVTRKMIEQHVWNGEIDLDSNVVDVYISRLRTKLAGDKGQDHIQTIRGLGYRLKSETK
jgi:DNA-binding response OmpR family regulator